MNGTRLMTAREVADMLGVSTGALLRWARAGKVPAVKLPSGAIRFVPEQIDAWIQRNTLKGISDTADAIYSKDAT